MALEIAILGTTATWAQPSGNGDDRSAPVYERRAFEWSRHDRGKFDRRFDRRFQRQPPQVNSAWFQRPYPYHLDYYKMRYGGSYAPYFGNIYGPPQVVTAPPYYGPYYGGSGFEFANPGDGAYGVPNSAAPIGPTLQAPVEESVPPHANELPAP